MMTICRVGNVGGAQQPFWFWFGMGLRDLRGLRASTPQGTKTLSLKPLVTGFRTVLGVRCVSIVQAF